MGQDLKEFVLRVFRELWDDYTLWENTYSTTLLESFAYKPLHQAKNQGLQHEGSPVPIASAESSLSEADTASTRSSQVFRLVEGPSSSKHVRSRVIRTPIVELPPSKFPPTPSYESCAPTRMHILRGDDPPEMPFIPYADENFDIDAYADDHDAFAWQVDRMSDPYVEWVCLATACRVVSERKVSLEDIDNTKALPFALLSRPSSSCAGLLGNIKRNDLPDWPPLRQVPALLAQITAPIPPEHECTQRLENLLDVFCANPSCVQAYCWTHEMEVHDLRRDPRYVLPLNRAKSAIPALACGDDCFLHLHHDADSDSESEIDSEVDYEALHLLYLLFSLSPDASSCSISSLSRIPSTGAAVPCSKVHQLREAWHRQLEPPDYGREDWRARPDLDHGLKTDSESELQLFRPCTHPGPCTISTGSATATNCTCISAGRPCERTCCCPPDCPHRWKGCHCTSPPPPTRSTRSKLCTSKHPHRGPCACLEAGRECDPELCRCCTPEHGLGLNGEVQCGNVQIQLSNAQKRLSVRKGEWGFGVVLCEDVRAADLICEYVGELIYDPTWRTRHILAEHRGRFYVHKLNAELNVDALFVGNEARYINHAKGREANCTVKIKVVNGDHRIGVYAKRNLKNGTELFINYGPEAEDAFTHTDP